MGWPALQKKARAGRPCHAKCAAAYAVLVTVVWLATAHGAVTAPPVGEMAETFVPGLKLTIKSAAAGGQQQVDYRAARLIAMTVPQGTRPSPFIDAGPFAAIWDGVITLRIRGEYTFRAFGSGSVKVMVNDQPVLNATGGDLSATKSELVKISKGKTKIHVEYESPPKGDAIFRLYWSEKTTPPEPVPPMILTHDAADAALRGQERVREGRTLFASLRCVKCHASNGASAGASGNGSTGMEELEQDAPDLSDAAERMKEDFVAAWIADPKSINPRAQMPRMFKQDDKQAPADVAAFLMTLGNRSAQGAVVAEPTQAQMEAGTRLYTGLGCIACHTPPGFAEKDSVKPPRIPHSYIAAKYATAGALREFLKDPQAHFKWSRMGNFKLSDSELDTLVAYLYRAPKEATETSVRGDAQRGKKIFQTSGCLNCHTAKGIDSTAPKPELAKSEWNNGCLANDAGSRRSAPDFGFSDEQRGQLKAFAAAGVESVHHDSPIEFAERQVAEVNCKACHARDKEDDLWSTLRPQIEGMLSKLPPEKIDKESPYFGDQSRPPLTWIGEKLRPQWMEQFIAGKVAYKPRPWLLARMPSFGARAHGLAVGLTMEHGYPAVAPASAAPDPELAKVGKQLIAKNGGLSCITCHDVGGTKALSAFEAPAPNFAYTTERLNHDYYMRWTLKPQKVQPGTRMPDFADAEGKTSLKTFFNADAHQQFEAIWNYLLAGPNIEAPQ